jgi:hypothetical protein
LAFARLGDLVYGADGALHATIEPPSEFLDSASDMIDSLRAEVERLRAERDKALEDASGVNECLVMVRDDLAALDPDKDKPAHVPPYCTNDWMRYILSRARDEAFEEVVKVADEYLAALERNDAPQLVRVAVVTCADRIRARKGKA